MQGNTALQFWDQGRALALEHAVMPLSYDSHKGSSGRVGVLGGSGDFTGAPFYAAMASLNAGADLSFVFCANEAALPIKSYSPELMVTPVYSVKEFEQSLHDGETSDNKEEQE
jgi:ATP-dependent NAD(P)H-hydrate dehydratase